MPEHRRTADHLHTTVLISVLAFILITYLMFICTLRLREIQFQPSLYHVSIAELTMISRCLSVVGSDQACMSFLTWWPINNIDRY